MTSKKGILISFQNVQTKVNEKHCSTFSNTDKFYLLWIVIVSDLHYRNLSHFYVIEYYEKLYRKASPRRCSSNCIKYGWETLYDK